MTTKQTQLSFRSLFVLGSLAVVLLPAVSIAGPAAAQVTRAVDDSSRVALRGSRSPLARSEFEAGRMAPERRLEGVSLALGRTPAQEADLKALIAAQQDEGSPLFRRWLSPGEFAARFGAAASDIAAVAAWLTSRGLTVTSVSPTQNSLSVSGSVRQLEAAFGTEIHYYRHGDRTDFAPSTEVSIPAALSPLVTSVRGLSSFRPRSHLRSTGPALAPEFTSGQSQKYFVAPADLATIYDIGPAYKEHIDGTGQSIAVVGQSLVLLKDIENFQIAAGIKVHDPVLTQANKPRPPVVTTGDESESDLDLEYASSIAPGATIYLVFVSGNASLNVWDALQYAVEQNVAPIISMSYGTCEPSLSSTDHATLNGILAQAAAQGQSVIVSAGDSGSTDCFGGLGISNEMALAVDFPASSQYATGIGGTEFLAADVAIGNTQYWIPPDKTTPVDILSSALSYIPEQVWNDDAASEIAAGGGESTLTQRPGWQSGVPGIPSGTFRLVPDVSLDASAVNAPFLYCSSDSSLHANGSCAKGFRDSANTFLTVGGGTSFSAPIFAGMVALIGQKVGVSGLGVVAPTLYKLASDSTTYASVFHDIVPMAGGSSGNGCSAETGCTTGATYLATTGYDEASGLGSVDFYNLMNAWPVSGSTLVSSKTTVTPDTFVPAADATDAIAIAVASASQSSTAVPTGNVAVAVDGSTVVDALPLSAGSATYSFSSSSSGSHTISATYVGDSNYRPSIGTVTVVVGGTPGFTLSTDDTTVASGGTGTSTVKVTPLNGYAGTITWTIASAPVLSGGCFSLADTAISGSSPVDATLTIHTTSTLCTAAMLAGSMAARGAGGSPRRGDGNTNPGRHAALAGTLLLGIALASRRRAGIRLAASILCVAVLGLSACGGGSGGSGSQKSVAKGSYGVAVLGRDTKTPSITATATFTLTVD